MEGDKGAVAQDHSVAAGAGIVAVGRDARDIAVVNVTFLGAQVSIPSLQGITITHHDIGHDWNFSRQSARYLGAYFQATQLLLDCLDLAIVTDRQAIEGTLCLPPGAWTEAAILGKKGA